MKHRQYGFSAVEIILVIIVVGLLGFGGWYVWQANNQQLTTSTSQNTTADPYADWKAYSKGSLTFKYPADWTLTEIGPGPQLKSGNYASTGLQSITVTKGASISVTNPGAAQTTITAENYNTSSAWSASNSNFKVVTINGKKAAQYNVSSDIINTVLFGTNGEMVQAQFQFAASDYDATLSLYNHLLETVSIK